MVLMGDDLAKLATGVMLGRRAARRGNPDQNLLFATGMICLLIVSSFTGWLTKSAPAVVGHEGSTLLVTLNGLRLLRN